MSYIALVLFLFSSVEVVAAQEEPEEVEAMLDLPRESEENLQQRLPTAKPRSRQTPSCFQAEPDVQEVVKAAWDQAGLLREDDLSRQSRVRVSGWLPRVSGGVSKDMDDSRDFRYEPGSPRVDQLHQDTGFDWDVGMSWDMSEAIFRSEELQVAREAARRSRERMDLASEVIRLYFSRKRLLLQNDSSPGSDLDIRLAETTATLDAWTGKRFQQQWCSEKEDRP